MTGISVRQAVLADIDAISPLFDDYRQFYGRASDLESARKFLLERINHGESAIFVAEDAGRAVGFAQLYPSFSSASLARTFIVNDLYVHEVARRRGVASQLLAAAQVYARTLGAVRLTLSTAMTNETAQALYQTTGWMRDQQFYVYHLTL